MKTYLVLPDLHFPYQDQRFIKLVTKVIKEIQPDGLVQLGDAIDAFQISTYSKDPARRNTLAEDIEEYKLQLNEWSRHLKRGSVIHLLEGNHEYRLKRFIATQARDLHGLIPDWPTLLEIDLRTKCGPHKWHWHPYTKWNSCSIGDCILLHGFYYNQHTAMTMLTKYKTNCIAGHTHRVQYVTDGVHYAATLGHGSNETETAHNPVPTGWQQAMGLLHVDQSGKTSLEIITVKNGKAVLRGKTISV